MLEELRISGLGVIADATLELGPGLSVVTGETGAGKTMVVTGLSLLLGGRGDSGLVRAGAGRAAVDGRFLLTPAGGAPVGGPVGVRLAEIGADVEDGSLLLSRTLLDSGRSRAAAGGRPVPVTVLAELGDDLVARHDQADQLRLAKPAAQRAALDRYGGDELAELRTRYRTGYERWRAATAMLSELTTLGRDRLQEADLLRHGLAAIAAGDPRPGEDTELSAVVARLAHAEGLRRAAGAAHAALAGEAADAGDRDARGLIAAARQALDAETGHDPALDALAGRLAEVGYLAADLAADLASYAAGVDADPAALDTAQERLAALQGLTRRYGPELSDVLAWARAGGARLADLDGDESRVPELTAEVAALESELWQLARSWTEARAAAGAALARSVTAELADLALPGAAFDVAVTAGTSLGPDGADDVSFFFTAHPDAPPRPLGRAASGGELSRIMLAIEVVLAGADPVPTFVFDEVDAGVGGRAAVEVGRRLARLASAAQVLAVTHLPQVAAFADRHFVVEKGTDGLVTSSGVRLVTGEERLTELSRMLAGLADSELGRGHAEELLAVAAAAKTGG